LGVDAVELGGFNQGEGDCHGFATALGKPQATLSVTRVR
jgi:hypothetical protein